MEALLNARRHIRRGASEKAKQGVPEYAHDYWWNSREAMKWEMDPTRMGFGRRLEHAGTIGVVTLHADISG